VNDVFEIAPKIVLSVKLGTFAAFNRTQPRQDGVPNVVWIYDRVLFRDHFLLLQPAKSFTHYLTRVGVPAGLHFVPNEL
jgi:hypothetical protein